LLLTENRIIVN